MNLTPEQYELIRYSGSYLMDQCGVRYARKKRRWPKVTDEFVISPAIRDALNAKRAAATPNAETLLGLAFGPRLKPEEPWIGGSWPFFFLLLSGFAFWLAGSIWWAVLFD